MLLKNESFIELRLKNFEYKTRYMNKLNLLFVAFVFITISIFGQDSDLPGQDFDLEALPSVLEKVSDFEALEKAINEEGNDVNNLDLDGNNEVDYVMIQMENEGDTYIAFLRVAMSETEYQDVATIEMEKQSSVTATFQIVGDEALYGKDYILEPEGGVVDISESSSGSTGGKGGPSPYLIPPPPAVRVTICVGVLREPSFTMMRMFSLSFKNLCRSGESIGFCNDSQINFS